MPLCVLADGTVLIGNINSSQTSFFDPVSHTFSPGPNKGDRCAEESFTLLPDTTVLAVDCTSIPNAEKYVPSSNSWVTAGTTPSTLPQSCAGIVPEIGLERPRVMPLVGERIAASMPEHLRVGFEP